MLRRIEHVVEAHETLLTVILIGVALLCLGTAIWGRAEHKAALLLYVALP